MYSTRVVRRLPLGVLPGPALVRSVMVGSSFPMREAVRQARLDAFGAKRGRNASTPRSGSRRARQALQGHAILEWSEPRVADYGLKGFDAVQARESWLAEGMARRMGGTTREGRLKAVKATVGERLMRQNPEMGASKRKEGDGEGSDGEKLDSGDEKELLRELEEDEAELRPLGRALGVIFNRGPHIDRARFPEARAAPEEFDPDHPILSSLRMLDRGLPEGWEEVMKAAGRDANFDRIPEAEVVSNDEVEEEAASETRE
jgi:hypothetical protein